MTTANTVTTPATTMNLSRLTIDTIFLLCLDVSRFFQFTLGVLLDLRRGDRRRKGTCGVAKASGADGMAGQGIDRKIVDDVIGVWGGIQD